MTQPISWTASEPSAGHLEHARHAADHGRVDESTTITDQRLPEGRTPANKGRRYPPEVLTPEEIQALLDACALKPHTELRNQAFLAILYRTGLRCSEALALEPKDVDFFGSSIRVLHGKGDRARTVGIDEGALDMIREWVVEREHRGFTASQSLFCTSTGKPMSGSYVREQIKRLGIKAGISKRVHAHGLRHTHAFELMMEGIPISIIQRQLGHASLATTDTYLSHIAPKHVIDAISGRRWSVDGNGSAPPTPTDNHTQIGAPAGDRQLVPA